MATPMEIQTQAQIKQKLNRVKIGNATNRPQNVLDMLVQLTQGYTSESLMTKRSDIVKMTERVFLSYKSQCDKYMNMLKNSTDFLVFGKNVRMLTSMLPNLAKILLIFRTSVLSKYNKEVSQYISNIYNIKLHVNHMLPTGVLSTSYINANSKQKIISVESRHKNFMDTRRPNNTIHPILEKYKGFIVSKFDALTNTKVANVKLEKTGWFGKSSNANKQRQRKEQYSKLLQAYQEANRKNNKQTKNKLQKEMNKITLLNRTNKIMKQRKNSRSYQQFASNKTRQMKYSMVNNETKAAMELKRRLKTGKTMTNIQHSITDPRNTKRLLNKAMINKINSLNYQIKTRKLSTNEKTQFLKKELGNNKLVRNFNRIVSNISKRKTKNRRSKMMAYAKGEQNKEKRTVQLTMTKPSMPTLSQTTNQVLRQNAKKKATVPLTRQSSMKPSNQTRPTTQRKKFLGMF